MIPRRIWFTAVALLLLIRLGAWAFGALWPITDLRVVNQSGTAITGLQVCLQPGECVQQAQLRNNRAWRVNLPIEGDGGAVLTFHEQAETQPSSAYITRGLGVHWTILPGGRVEQKQ